MSARTTGRLLRPATLSITTIVCAGLGTPAHADWPTDAAEPLFIGTAPGPGIERHTLTVTADDAVWVAWQDGYCESDFRIQRLDHLGASFTSGGMIIQPDPTCGFVNAPALVASGNEAVVARAFADLAASALLRFDHTGLPTWGSGLLVPLPVQLADLLTLPNQDIIEFYTLSNNIYADRINPAGKQVWSESKIYNNAFGSNFRFIDAVPDADGGAFMFWDAPTAYRRSTRVARIDGEGTMLFGPISPMKTGEILGASRHTDPVAVADGVGGAYFIWTLGREDGFTTAPVLLQRIAPDGLLAHDLAGLRISLGTERQFDPQAVLDPATGDLMVLWRDDVLSDQTLRVQRLSAEGDRMWGDEGILIAPLDPIYSHYAPVLWNDQLAIAVSGPSGVSICRVNADGTIDPEVWPISPVGPTRAIRMVESGTSLVVVWHSAEPGFDNFLYAQRINANGRLGNPACNSADFAAPFGHLDFFDVAQFLAAFAGGDEQADLIADGEHDFFDVAAYLSAFADGCAP